mmetsp:Transcript_3559/g.6062  ORF Transcript_3559/g.6062 Transcript_3559/m.6062 type:complete len:151 (-) Transcript_3559:577-1029(-)
MFKSKKSITEQVEKEALKNPGNAKSYQQREWEKEEEEIDLQVQKLVHAKRKEFSFEIYADWEKGHFKEVDDVQEFIDKTVETYQLLKKAGKLAEASEVREKLIETKYAKEHLKMVMNMDFTKPTPKMLKMAKENNINLNDPGVIEEFKKI